MRAARSGPLRRLLVVIVLSGALVLGAGLQASAEPTTPDRREVAQDVATSACKAFPRVPGLTKKMNPRDLCISVVVENIDPEGSNNGVKAACVAALPITMKALASACAEEVDKLLDPARVVFLDKVVPTAQQIACVASTPGAFDCLAKQIHVWLKDAVGSLWAAFSDVLTSPTSTIRIVDGWSNPGFTALYQDVGLLAIYLLLALALVSLLQSAVRLDPRLMVSTLSGAVAWGVFWVSGIALALVLLKASDAAASFLAGAPDGNGVTPLDKAATKFGDWIDYIAGKTDGVVGGVYPVYNPGSFIALLICCLLILAIVMTLIALTMRNVSLLLLVAFFPLTLAGRAGPPSTQGWLVAAARVFLTLVLAKPLIVVAVRLGAVLVTVPGDGQPQATAGDALLGVVLILTAAFLPGVVYKFSGGLLNTPAGQAPRADAGTSERLSHSAQSLGDSTRMIMHRNAPGPLAVAGIGARAGNLTPGSVGAWSTGGSAARAGGGLGSVASAGLAAAALVGGAAESAAKWTAGQAATGGGVFGDVDSPHIPTAPVPRTFPRAAGQHSGTPQPEPHPAQPGPGSLHSVSQLPTAPQQPPNKPALRQRTDVAAITVDVKPNQVLDGAAKPATRPALPPASPPKTAN